MTKRDTLFDYDPEEDDFVDDRPDHGPRVVVLHTGVSGATGMHERGKVIGIADLIGFDMLEPKNEREAKRRLHHYLKPTGEDGVLGPAVRPATADEAKVDFVVLPEGVGDLTGALASEREKRQAAEIELENLRKAAPSKAALADNSFNKNEEVVLAPAPVKVEEPAMPAEKPVPQVVRPTATAQPAARVGPPPAKTPDPKVGF